MPRKKKVVEPVMPQPPIASKDYPEYNLTKSDLVKMNHKNGAPIYEGYQDLILEVMPDAISNKDVKYPVLNNGQAMTIRDLTNALEAKSPFLSEELWKAYKKYGDKVGCSLFVQMATLELELKEVSDGSKA